MSLQSLSIGAAAVALKLLLFPAYRSTDFEVHRNWLALTFSLPLDKWYYEDTSEWTLDYPPLFAFFQYVLAWPASLIEPAMLRVSNLGYASDATVLYLRATVLFSELLFHYGAWRCVDALHGQRPAWIRLGLFALLVFNPGLFIVDSIHFQYNGFVLGFLFLSVAEMTQGNHLLSAFLFSNVLTLKHTNAVLGPAFAVYLLAHYCMAGQRTDQPSSSHWIPFRSDRFLALAAVTAATIAIPFAPFYQHLHQIFARLFPFGRGLTHAYWAPNFWAFYSAADRVLMTVFRRLNIPISSEKLEAAGSVTRGLVSAGSGRFVILPDISPSITFAIVLFFIAIALAPLVRRKSGQIFCQSLVLSSLIAFMFGWHVHEKAIIIPILLLTLLIPTEESNISNLWLILSTVGHLSLFPLVNQVQENFIKWLLTAIYTLAAFLFVQQLRGYFRSKTTTTSEKTTANDNDNRPPSRKEDKISTGLPNFTLIVLIAVIALIVLFCDAALLWLKIAETSKHPWLAPLGAFLGRFPFLWLMAISLVTFLPLLFCLVALGHIHLFGQ